jgi:nicotinic acid mononucleotide adenylyltransferase
VIPRDPVIPEPLTPAIPADRVERISARPVKVSSTAIRERLSLGHSISGLVPRAVESYILKQGLYREGIHREPIGGDRDG